MAKSEPIAWKATSRMVFNQTARTLGNLGLSGVSQKLGRPLGRNSACSIVPRRDFGCSHQRKRANNKTPAGRRVGRSSISGDNPEGSCLISCTQPGPLGRRSADDGRQGEMKPPRNSMRQELCTRTRRSRNRERPNGGEPRRSSRLRLELWSLNHPQYSPLAPASRGALFERPAVREFPLTPVRTTGRGFVHLPWQAR